MDKVNKRKIPPGLQSVNKLIFHRKKKEDKIVFKGSITYKRKEERTGKANSHGIRNTSEQNHYAMKTEK